MIIGRASAKYFDKLSDQAGGVALFAAIFCRTSLPFDSAQGDSSVSGKKISLSVPARADLQLLTDSTCRMLICNSSPRSLRTF